MVRVYRDQPLGMTYVERGSGGPVLRVPDHGEADQLWNPPPSSLLVYDDELHEVENETLSAARERLIRAVGASADLPATAKATVRKIITEVIA